jgi:hypothetical protein
MNEKWVIGVGIAVVAVVGIYFFWFSGNVSASHFSNENISFDYPNNFILDNSSVADENSEGYFVCALNSPSNSVTLVIYQIPLTTTKNITNQTTANTTISSSNNSSNSSSNLTPTNTTITVTVNNLEVYLDGVKNRGGDAKKVLKNNYTFYVSGDLKSPYANYTSNSRISKIYTSITINETAIVKDGFKNFYVIELINGNSTPEGNDAYNQVLNTFKIR